MATDRMYLKCPCGAMIPIARYLLPPWYAYENTAALDKWFDEHQHCDEDHYPARPTLVYGTDFEEAAGVPQDG